MGVPDSNTATDDLPVFTWENVKGANVSTKGWMPLPNVLLDDTCIILAVMVTLANKTARHKNWPQHFVENSHLRAGREPIGRASHVVAAD